MHRSVLRIRRLKVCMCRSYVRVLRMSPLGKAGSKLRRDKPLHNFLRTKSRGESGVHEERETERVISTFFQILT